MLVDLPPWREPKFVFTPHTTPDQPCLGITVKGKVVFLPNSFKQPMEERLIKEAEALVGWLRRSPTEVANRLNVTVEHVIRERQAILDLFKQREFVPQDTPAEPQPMENGTGLVLLASTIALDS